MSAVKKEKKLIFMILAAGLLLLLVMGYFSYGWFVDRRTSSGKNTLLSSADSDFELGAIDTNGIYDEYLSAEDGTKLSGIKTGKLFGKISPTATGGGKNEIKWLVNSDSNFNNYTGQSGIQPGSSGVLSFYVIAKRNTDLDITFRLDTILYTDEAKPIDDSNPDNSAYIVEKDSSEAILESGHILFFESYDEASGLYSDKITDGKFQFSKVGAESGTAYQVDIYWVWPYVADQLLLPESDSFLSGKSYKKLISDADTAVLAAEMAASPEKYFADTSIDIAAVLENSVKGTDSGSFDAELYGELNDSWNAADQMIGKKVGFIELQLSNDDT